MMPEKPQTEDIIVYKGNEQRRKTKLSLEDEFMHDLTCKLALESLKRRCIEGVSKVREDLPLIQSNVNKSSSTS